MNRFLVSLTLIVFSLLLTSLNVNGQTNNVRYRIEDLGALPGENSANQSFANGINSTGLVCGTAQTNSGNFVPFRWTEGIMENLGSFGGINDQTLGAKDINDFGWVTGSLRTSDNKVNAFLHINSNLINLGGGGAGFPSGDDFTFGNGINNRGEVVGRRGSSGALAFYYDGLTLRNLNSLLPAGSGWTLLSAFDINDKRQIVGGGTTNNPAGQSPFRFDLGGNRIVYIGTSNPPGSSSSVANAVNNLGKSVGFLLSDPSARGFAHADDGGNLPLSTAFSPCSSNNSVPQDVNTRGTIVGSFNPFSSGPGCNLPLFQNRAALWLPSGQGFDLNNLIDPALGWTLKEANAINDRGQIVGNGTRMINGVTVNRAFRLTPIRPENNQVSDFDGDGKTDLAIFRPNGSFWYVLRSSNNSFTGAQFGIASDKIVPGDFDGDNRTDTTVYRDGNWYLMQSGNNAFRAVQFGISEDIPQAADFDADGKTDIAVFRPSNGFWYVLRSSDNAFVPQQFGQTGDKPAVGDYDGDARADYAVFRPSSGVWFVLQSTQGFRAANLGTATDKVVQGDYDGDGRTDFAVFRPSDGNWHLLRSRDGLLIAQFGVSTDEPVPGDYDGDGIFDISVFRNGIWYLQQTAGGFRAAQFGSEGDKPIPAAYIPATN